jgi:hypothetical protein
MPSTQKKEKEGESICADGHLLTVKQIRKSIN